VRGANEVPECKQLLYYFDACIKINKYFGTLKKWYPESFAESEYSRDRPNLQDIGL